MLSDSQRNAIIKSKIEHIETLRTTYVASGSSQNDIGMNLTRQIILYGLLNKIDHKFVHHHFHRWNG